MTEQRPPRRKMPIEGVPHFALERRMCELRAADPSFEHSWPDLIWPVLPDRALAAARTAMTLFINTNGFVKTPSLVELEEELVDFVCDLLEVPPDGGAFITTGGTESNYLAVRAALTRARKLGSVGERARPNLVMPLSAHGSFHKHSLDLGVEVRRTAIGDDHRAQPQAIDEAIDERTILVVASAPDYSFGLFDPIPAIAEIAHKRDIWMHVDACVGGFLIPHLRDLGLMPCETGFQNPGVTSMAADLHKLGFTPTGISTFSVRDAALADYHTYLLRLEDGWGFTDYRRQTFGGSRSGAIVAAAWATLASLGREGYREIARAVVAAAHRLTEGLEAIEGVRVLAPSECGVFVFTGDERAVRTKRLAGYLQAQGFTVTYGLNPDRIHILLSPVPETVLDRFVDAIDEGARQVRDGRSTVEAQPLIYGG